MGLEFFRRAVELGEQYARPGQTVRPHHPDQRHQDRRASGRGSSPRTASSSASASTGRASCTTPTGATRPASRRSTRSCAAWTRCASTAWTGTRSPPSTPPTRTTRRRSTASSATTAAASSSSSSPSSSAPCENGVPYGYEVTDRSVSPEGWGAFLIGVFDEWVRRDVGKVFVQHFDVALANWYGEPSGLCVHTAACGTALAMEFNGDVYACDHFVEPDYLRGNIHEQPPRRARQRRAAAAVRQRQADGAAAVLPGLRRALRLPRRLRQGPHRGARRTGSRGSTTSAPATRRSSTTSTRP